MNINQFHDGETIRQQRNLTAQQKRVNAYTKEGVVVNNFIKEKENSNIINLDETYDTLVISEDVKMPSKLNENINPKEKSLIPISAIAIGVMAGVTLLTAFIRKNAKINREAAAKKLETLPSTTRNVAINEETHQAIYRMIKNPTPKTLLAGSGVLVLSAMAFMGKTFFDGYKDVWVKKKEADIQKNLQENLIDVETQSFSGKIQIIRSMLSEKAKELGKYVSTEIKPKKGSKTFGGVTFGESQPKREAENSNIKYFLLGAGTIASIIGLAFLAMKNLNAGKKHIDRYLADKKDTIKKIIETSKDATKENDKITLKVLFHDVDASKEYIEASLKKLNWNPEEIDEFTKEVHKATAKVNEAMGGDGSDKTTFYSHVNDYRAHLFNYLLNTENKQFKQLFFGITGLTAFSYGGKLAGDAVKEVQVKKINAETEINLQKRLVSTELRNFKSKKDAAIQPLIEEFYRQAKLGKPKEELKVMADNILLEIKNGPPFVYS